MFFYLQELYPDLVRMKYSKDYQYTLICNFLKSRRWDDLVSFGWTVYIDCPTCHFFRSVKAESLWFHDLPLFIF